MKSGRAITALPLHSTQLQTNTLERWKWPSSDIWTGRRGGNYTTSEGCVRKVCGKVWEWQGDSLHIVQHLTLLKQGKADTCGLTIYSIYSFMKVKLFSRVRLFATPWTVTYQALLSMGFSRQEYWNGLPFPSPMHESEKWKGKLLSRVQLFATPWTTAYQALLSMGFSRQEYWSGRGDQEWPREFHPPWSLEWEARGWSCWPACSLTSCVKLDFGIGSARPWGRHLSCRQCVPI